MKKCARAALAFVAFAWGGQVLAADPACTYHEEADTAVAATTTKDSLTLLGIDPAEGKDLRRDMVVAVDVQFRIADFQPKTYFVVGMFPMAGFTSMFPGESASYPMLEHPSGKVHLCVPLQEVYEHPGMVWPLSMSVEILKMTDGRISSVTAYTRKVKFKSPDAPAQAKALPDEYYDALQHTSSYFDNRVVLYKLCIARFPAMQPAFTKAYRAWEGRHRADIELAAELEFAKLKDMVNGRADGAASIADAATAVSRKYYEDLPAAALKHECDMKLSEMADPDDTTNIVIGDEMAILRKYSKKTAEKSK